MLEVPFALPAHFLARLGWTGNRRVVAVYWEPLGDEVAICDDQSSACGLGDQRVYQEFSRREEVMDWLDEIGASLGNSEFEATHWLLIDTETGRAFVGPWREARHAVIRQTPPD